MKTLHSYLLRQVLLSLMMTVAVFTFVLLLGNVMKEILALLIARQISLGMVGKAIGLLIPFIMSYVLPFGMLTAVLLTFGRFSADQELTAVRASGLSLLALITPILLLSIILCGVCAAINMWVAPMCRDAYKDLIYELSAKNATSLITEDRFIVEIPGIVLYVRKRSGDSMEDVRLYKRQSSDGEITSRTMAESGKLIWDQSGTMLSIELNNVLTEVKNEERKEDPDFIGPPAPPGNNPGWQPIQAGSITDGPYDLGNLNKSERKPKLSEMNFLQLLNERAELEARGISAMPVRVQMHRQASFSLACFAFTLLAIPLAISAHRRETSIGIAISLILVLVYYSFMILGEALQSREALRPHLILWAPNFMFEALGAWFLFNANRGKRILGF